MQVRLQPPVELQQHTMDDEATQQQQSNVGSPADVGRGGHMLADFYPGEMTVRLSDERDGVEAAEATQPLALGPDEGLPSSGRKVWPPQPAMESLFYQRP